VDLDAFGLLSRIGDATVVSALQRFNPRTGAFETATYEQGMPAGVPFPIETGVSYLVYMRQDRPGFALPVGVMLSVDITSPANGAILTTSPLPVSGTVTGVEPITVTVNGIAAVVTNGTFTATVPLTAGPNTLVALATDAVNAPASDSITVVFEPVDYRLAIGEHVLDSRLFSAAAAVLDQVAFFTVTEIGVPAGIVYATTAVGRISATEIQIGFQIDATPGAATGIHSFQIEYGLLDANFNPLGPLMGNRFDFRIEVRP
jgi:hypothetical protein